MTIRSEDSHLEARSDRQRMVEYMQGCLIGPAAGENEEFEGSPFLRYMMGMLFPRGQKVAQARQSIPAADDGSVGSSEEAEGAGTASPSLSADNEMLPASVGLSFLVRGESIHCRASASQYRKFDGPHAGEQSTRRRGGRASQWWRRESLPAAEVVVTRQQPRVDKIFEGAASVMSEWRPWTNGCHLVTVTLTNEQVGGERLEPSVTLFQVHLDCEVDAGSYIEPYPQAVSTGGDRQDDEEVAYLYRDTPPFARGHGAAAVWRITDGKCREVSVTFMPSYEVPPPTFELGSDAADPRYREISFLAAPPSREELAKVLRSFSQEYQKWTSHLVSILSVSGDAVGTRLAKRADQWALRMARGVELITGDDLLLKAFTLANRAMGMQMRIADQVKKGPFAASDRRSHPPLSDLIGLRWRPFQVAFALGVIESLADSGSPDRDTVDVIWFPTGGGKTEAYLLVAAFEILRRRLVYGDEDRATAVISRYTLRMLTAQQFERTASVIAALELLRREANGTLGQRPISLGLWVGAELTPNRYEKAKTAFDDAIGSRKPENKFLLSKCPLCGTEVFPAREGLTPEESGVRAGSNSFEFFCPSTACDFNARIPLATVDDALYDNPPSVLLGTLDKFAALPWSDQPRAFFGGPAGDAPPPSLIIQDELHLISGPLGSLAAVYDVAIDTIIKRRSRGIGPKIISSTATIKNSHEQIRGLYGRRSAVFPQPVSEWSDAYFFRLDREKPGRLYLGAMAQGYVSPMVAAGWVSAGLLQAASEVPLSDKRRNGYWTVLSYMNSRRELGRMLNAANGDVAERMRVIAGPDGPKRLPLNVMELSSQMTRNMTDAFAELERPLNAGGRPVDYVPCTNIISVGVDIDRLGVMQMNGQPKLTSEYIQATSRVGRSKDVPGLVLTLYSATKPRDRSHYEDFLAYHESLYRFVEPTSVTPYAPPARERTLHAAVVGAVRHSTRWYRNDDAASVIDDDADFRAVIEALLGRMSAADEREAESVTSAVEEIVADWMELRASSLRYDVSRIGVHFTGLLRDFGANPGLGRWQTMRSVRNVEPEVNLQPVGWSR
jgi:hypothetical protein